MKVLIAISGASGASLGLKALRALPESVEKHLIVSDHAKIVLEKEENVIRHEDEAIWSSVASGSFGIDAMLIIPCSMNTLAKIRHCGQPDDAGGKRDDQRAEKAAVGTERDAVFTYCFGKHV